MLSSLTIPGEESEHVEAIIRRDEDDVFHDRNVAFTIVQGKGSAACICGRKRIMRGKNAPPEYANIFMYVYMPEAAQSFIYHNDAEHAVRIQLAHEHVDSPNVKLPPYQNNMTG